MKNKIEAPETIYLQWHGEADADDNREVSTDDVTWSAERIFDTDIKYQRASQYHRALNWVVPDDRTPTDGNYLTLIEERRIYAEIAPWRNGKYQGTYTMGVNLGMSRVLAWMPIPPFDETIISKKQ